MANPNFPATPGSKADDSGRSSAQHDTPGSSDSRAMDSAKSGMGGVGGAGTGSSAGSSAGSTTGIGAGSGAGMGAGSAGSAGNASSTGSAGTGAHMASNRESQREGSSSNNGDSSKGGQEVLDRVVRGAHETVDRLAETVAPHVQRLSQGFGHANDAMHSRAGEMRELGDEWTDSLRTTVRDHPVAAVVTALALGVLLARLTS